MQSFLNRDILKRFSWIAQTKRQIWRIHIFLFEFHPVQEIIIFQRHFVLSFHVHTMHIQLNFFVHLDLLLFGIFELVIVDCLFGLYANRHNLLPFQILALFFLCFFF